MILMINSDPSAVRTVPRRPPTCCCTSCLGSGISWLEISSGTDAVSAHIAAEDAVEVLGLDVDLWTPQDDD